MLTQCPECKTTFRLHLNQLQAAGGKVRCSRCHSTFDALDNLVELPPRGSPEAGAVPTSPLAKAQPEAMTPPPRQQMEYSARSASPMAHTDRRLARDNATRLGGAAEQKAAEATKEDTLSAFIDELKESTSSEHEVAFAPQPHPPVERSQEAPRHRPPEGISTTSVDDLIGTALEIITPADSAAPPVDEPVTTPAQETLSGPSTAGGEEFFSITPDEESKPGALFEFAEQEGVVLAGEGETESLVEFAEETQAPLEAAAELDPLAGEHGLDTLFDLAEPGVTFLADEGETASFVELAEENQLPLEAAAEVEPLAGEHGLDTLFDLAEPEVTFLADEGETVSLVDLAEETQAPLEAAAEVEPLAGGHEFDTLADAAEPEGGELFDGEEAGALIELVDDTDEAGESEVEQESLLEEMGLDHLLAGEDSAPLFEESIRDSVEAEERPQQGDLLALLDEHPDEEAAEELPSAAREPLTTPVKAPLEPPASPLSAGQGDPRDPFSAEQIESMLSPSKEQLAAEEPLATQQAATPLASEGAMPGNTGQDDNAIRAAAPRGYTIPTELTQRPSRSATSSLLWGLGVLLMCAGLALQYLYYHRLQLVGNPQLRPLLAAMCELTGCELPPRRDLGKIELTERQMQFHPSYEESLLITATLTNRADFDQPYPLVEVIMSDIEQRVVARRLFSARQYLPNYQEGASFPAHSEAPLMLEVLDPGNNAVGFEFRFY